MTVAQQQQQQQQYPALSTPSPATMNADLRINLPPSMDRDKQQKQKLLHKDNDKVKSGANVPVADVESYSPAYILAVVAFYWMTSLAVVFLNKYILSSSEYKFPYPLVVTWYQLIVALALLVGLGRYGEGARAAGMGGSSALTTVPPFEFKSGLAAKIAPLSVIYVLMLAFNNLCLNYVEVTFYQVARSLTILFNIAFSYYFLGAQTSFNAGVACMTVFAGFVLGAWGELNFSWAGLIFGVGSSFFVALYGIYVKKSLVLVDNDQWRLLHYNTMLAILMLPGLILFSGELPDIFSKVDFLDRFGFWFVMTATGVTGFLINIAVFMQIKVTTPLTNTISGTAKACVQTLLAWAIWQNVITGTNGLGIFLSLAGSGMYSYVRYKEMKR